MTISLSPNQWSIAETFIAQFAPRTDAYNQWRSDQWVAVRGDLTPEVLALSMLRNPILQDGVRLDPAPPVGCYFPDREGMTHVGALDFDTDDGARQAFRVAEAMLEADAHAYIEHSRRGAHLWWPLAEPLPAWLVRRALRGALALAGVAPHPKIELRPATNEAPTRNGLGHALRLPLQRHPATGKSYELHHVADGPLPTLLADCLLAMREPTSVAIVKELSANAPVDLNAINPSTRAPRSLTERRGPQQSVSDVIRERWGVAVKVGRANRCIAPNHEDKHPSMSVTADDERVICKTPECVLNNGDRGYSAWELARLEL